MGMTVLYEAGDRVFEWDEDKARSNLRKHRVAFEEAAQVFVDTLCRFGDASTDAEQRDLIIGQSFARRLLLVVYVEVENGARYRIISARRATTQERHQYENR